MLNFKELSIDGNQLELLVREILLTKGYRVQWSGKGPDGGKDLICWEDRESEFLNDTKKWLIQCKHNSHSEKSVGIKDLDDIVDSCSHHDAHGYLLVCSTYPSSKVVERLEGITNNQKNNLEATYWDSVKIEQILSTPKLWKIAQSFFPISSKNSTWEIYATTNPNQWIANFRGYHFHLSNRVGSRGDYHFNSINDRIDEIENIDLPKDHFLRIRAVYFDDKNGCYSWFLDYMYPHDSKPKYFKKNIENHLGDGSALDDGQLYSFDVISRPYLPYSDHYDKDHYDYYEPFLQSYHTGLKRDEFNLDLKTSSWEELFAYEDKLKNIRNESFDKLTEKLKSIKCAKLIRSVNANIEDLDKFNNLRDWNELIEQINLEHDRFFSVWLFFTVKDKDKFFQLISLFPQEIETSLRLTQAYVITPKYEDDDNGCEIDFEDDAYEVTITVHPQFIHNSLDARNKLNDYLNMACEQIKDFSE